MASSKTMKSSAKSPAKSSAPDTAGTAEHAPPPASAAIAAGAPAPPFALQGDDGKEHRLADYAGKRVVLYFYPRDNTPGCTQEACDFRDLAPTLSERGAVVLGVSGDSVRTHQGFRQKHGLPFTLLSDPDLAVARSYGAFGEKVLYGKRSEGLIRSTFILDVAKDGRATVAKVYPKVSVKGHAQAVLESL